MLRDEAGSEQLHAHTLDLVDQAGVVEEPPAAEGHEVAELAGGDAELVLVLAAEHRDEEAILREVLEDRDERVNVGFTQSIAAISQTRVHLETRPDHHRERQAP